MSKIESVIRVCTKRNLKKVAVLTIVSVGLFAGYDLIRTGRTLLLLKHNVNNNLSCNTCLPEKPILPIVKRYGGEWANKILCKEWKNFLSTNRSAKEFAGFVKEFSPPEKEILVLVEQIISDSRDNWISGVESIHVKLPKDRLINWNSPTINYRDTRDISNLISGLSRYCVYKGFHKKAALLLEANVALVRQFISFRNSRGGMALIDSMICVAILRNISKVINSTDGLGGYSPEVFPLLKKKLEETDEMFTFSQMALATERSAVPSIVHYFDKESSGKLMILSICPDEEWMNKRLEHYYPKNYMFQKPYRDVEYLLKSYSERPEQIESQMSSPLFYLKAFRYPFRAVSEWIWTVACPNWAAAYRRECNVRSGLRIAYLNFALNSFKETKGQFPSSLDELKPFVIRKMLVNPITGKEFSYSPTAGRVIK